MDVIKNKKQEQANLAPSVLLLFCSVANSQNTVIKPNLTISRRSFILWKSKDNLDLRAQLTWCLSIYDHGRRPSCRSERSVCWHRWPQRSVRLCPQPFANPWQKNQDKVYQQNLVLWALLISYLTFHLKTFFCSPPPTCGGCRPKRWGLPQSWSRCTNTSCLSQDRDEQLRMSIKSLEVLPVLALYG